MMPRMSANHHDAGHAVVHRVRTVVAVIMLILPNVIVASSTATTAIAVVKPTLFAVATHRHRRRRRSHTHHLAQTVALAAKKKKTIVNTNLPSGGKGFGRNTAIIVHQADEVDDATSTTSSPIHAHLVQWLSSHPNTHITSKFVIRPSTLGGGYGGFANNFIPRGELILQIPRELCVTYDDVLHDSTCGHVFQSIKNERIPSWGMILIAGWIAKECVIAQREPSLLANHNNVDASNNSRIKHNPYLQSLPWTQGGSFSQDHILFWSQDEVETLLGGSKAYADALLIRNTVDDAIKRLADVMVSIIIHDSRMAERSSQSDRRQLPATMSNDEDEADIRERYSNAVKGAFVISLSRSFAEEVEYDNGTTIEVENVLLPLIDILQHSNTPNTMLESYDDCILLRARRDIEKGEELFHQYQEEREDVIPPHKFFTRYGFIPGVKEPIAELLKSKSDLFF